MNLSQDSYKLMGVDLKTSEDQEQDPSFQAYLNEEEEVVWRVLERSCYCFVVVLCDMT